MANLVVDEGNTLCKIGVIDGKELLYESSAAEFDEMEAAALVKRFGIRHAIAASTRGGGERICKVLSQRVERVLHFTSSVDVPIAIDYSSRETLGTDRIALAVGVVCVEEIRNALIVDIGSAITFDLVENGRFKGGNISLGVEMRFKALNHFTDSLPLCQATEPDGQLGHSTKEAVEQGVMQGILYEIEGYIGAVSSKKQEIVTIFCGGGANYFVNRIKNAIFAPRKLMFTGLNKILEYNVSQGNI